MTVRQEALLITLAAPLAALAGILVELTARSPSMPAWYLLLAAPLWEELFFRRVLQERLRLHHWGCIRLLGISLAAWLTALFFVLAHLPFQETHSLLLLLPALAVGRLFDRAGQVLPCILLHSWFNLCWLTMLRITAR